MDAPPLCAGQYQYTSTFGARSLSTWVTVLSAVRVPSFGDTTVRYRRDSHGSVRLANGMCGSAADTHRDTLVCFDVMSSSYQLTRVDLVTMG